MASKITSSIVALATWWFAAGERDPRTPQQLEREKWIFWAPWTGRFNRWMTVIPCFAGARPLLAWTQRTSATPPPPAPALSSANVHRQPVQVSRGDGARIPCVRLVHATGGGGGDADAAPAAC